MVKNLRNNAKYSTMLVENVLTYFLTKNIGLHVTVCREHEACVSEQMSLRENCEGVSEVWGKGFSY